MKKTISLFIILALMLTMITTSAFAAEKGVSVTVNGQKIEFLQAPINDNGTTFVPIRSILEALGQNVTWDQGSMTATAEDKAIGLVTKINTKSTIVETTQNGVERTYVMPTMPKLVNGTTLVPVRAVSEIFTKNVGWDQKTSTVIITDSTVYENTVHLDKEKAVEVFIKDVVAVQLSTDGSYVFNMPKNEDFVFIENTAEGAGLHTLYFKAEKANKDGKIEIQKVADGKVMETLTYKAAVKDPCDVAVTLDPEKTVDVKVGGYVKAIVEDNSASTGYQWFVTSLPASLQQVENKKVSANTTDGAVGVPSENTFVFKVISKGEVTLIMTNKRAWNDSNQKETVVSYKINATE